MFYADKKNHGLNLENYDTFLKHFIIEDDLIM